jgi:hypothetical protein
MHNVLQRCDLCLQIQDLDSHNLVVGQAARPPHGGTAGSTSSSRSPAFAAWCQGGALQWKTQSLTCMQLRLWVSTIKASGTGRVSVQHMCMSASLQVPQHAPGGPSTSPVVLLPDLQGCSPDTPTTVLQQFICICCSRKVGVLCVFWRTFPSEGHTSICQRAPQAAHTLGLPHGCCCLRLMC